MAKAKLPTPLPRKLWAIVNSKGEYQYCRNGTPELFNRKWEATDQNTNHLNGDRVIKVTLYQPRNNF